MTHQLVDCLVEFWPPHLSFKPTRPTGATAVWHNSRHCHYEPVPLKSIATHRSAPSSMPSRQGSEVRLSLSHAVPGSHHSSSSLSLCELSASAFLFAQRCALGSHLSPKLQPLFSGHSGPWCGLTLCDPWQQSQFGRFEVFGNVRILGEQPPDEGQPCHVRISHAGLVLVQTARNIIDKFGTDSSLLQGVGVAMTQRMQEAIPCLYVIRRLDQRLEVVVKSVAVIVGVLGMMEFRKQRLVTEIANCLHVGDKTEAENLVGHRD